MMNRQLEARALFYAIFVSIFVAMISGAMLLSSYHQHMLMGYYQTQERLLHNCQSGVELILGSKEEIIPRTIVDLFEQKKDSVSLEQKAWGLLDVAFVKSWSGHGFSQDSICKSFFVGKKPATYALKLAEGTEALKVCGNTEIVGAAFLPREGVERGFIHGRPYRGKKLIYGTTDVIKRTGNDYLKPRFEQLLALKKGDGNYDLNNDSLEQSFGQETVILAVDNFNTANLVLKGNVLIIARQSIQVSNSSVLEDVLLLAPSIVIESGFRGNIQAFAWDSLRVESDVILNYPSVLSLLPQEQTVNFSPELKIQAFSQVNGAVVVPTFRYSEYKSKVHVEKEALVEGQVWVNGLLQHDGVIHGSVYCHEFLLKTPAAVYENYLLDAIIDRSKLSDFYLAPSILGEPSKKAILKEIE